MAGDVAVATGVEAGTHRAGATIAAGLVVGLMTAINALAVAGLVFHDATPLGLRAGISAMLLGAAAAAVVMAFASGYAGLIASPMTTTAVGYVIIATLPDRVPGFPLDPALRAQMAVVLCGAVSLVSGVAFTLMGRFRLGSLARFLPYPVISGFNAGAGWLFLIGGVALTNAHSVGVPKMVDLEDPATFAQAAACVALAAAMVVATRVAVGRAWAWTVMPVLLVCGIGGFHLLRAGLGYDISYAVAHGWLLGPFPEGHIWEAPTAAAVTQMPWGSLARGSGALVSIILVGATTLLMGATGLEIEMRTSLDVNREMWAGGLANIAAGLAGGVIAGHAVGSTELADRMGGRHRAVGIVTGLVCASLLVLGTGVLNVIPRFAVGAMLVSIGAQRLIGRIWTERGQLPWHERGAVFLVLLAVVTFGYVQGVAAGLALTLVIFAWNYRRIPVVRSMASGQTIRSSVVRPHAEQQELARHGGTVRLCRLQGYLFFLNATGLLRPMQEPGVRFVILDFAGVTGLDTSACLILRRMAQLAEDQRVALWLTDLPPVVAKVLDRQDLPVAYPPGTPRFAYADEALQHAEDVLLAEAGLGAAAPPVALSDLMTETLKRPVTDAMLAPYLERVTLEEGGVMMRKNDPADAMYYIEEGTVSARIERADGTSMRVRTTTAGTIVGELGMFVGGRRTASVVAEGPCVAQRISSDAIARMERDDPHLANLFHRFLTTLLADKLADNSRMFEQMRA
ncbi:MAG: SLC26A/SulP transporter family protein [Proteobacteria bacterium]|nr:SLC26A/SulP transporter family protein [Pseudomonadota bacterium]